MRVYKGNVVVANILGCNTQAAHAWQIKMTTIALAKRFDKTICISAVNNISIKSVMAELEKEYSEFKIRIDGVPMGSKIIRIIRVGIKLLRLRISFYLKQRSAMLFTRSTFIAMIGVLARWRVVIELHDLPDCSSSFRRNLHIWLFRNVSQIICISNSLKCALSSSGMLLEKTQKKVVVTPLSLYQPRAKSANLKTDYHYIKQLDDWISAVGYRILYTGSLEKIDTEDFLKFLNLFKRVSVLLIGGSDQQWKTIESKFDRRFLDGVKCSHIGFTNDQDLLAYARRNSDGFLLSNPETLKYSRFTSPLKLFEYAHEGKLVFLIGKADFLDGMKYTGGIMKQFFVSTEQRLDLNKIILTKKLKSRSEFKKFCKLYSSDSRIDAICEGLIS